jgi:ABC-2 type transport system ATP-binding protein
VISRGRLVAQGAIDELTRDAAAPVRVRTPQPDRLREALAAKDIVAELDGNGWLSVHGAPLEAVGDTAAECGIAVHELLRDRPSLEDVFFQLTGDTEAGR